MYVLLLYFGKVSFAKKVFCKFVVAVVSVMMYEEARRSPFFAASFLSFLCILLKGVDVEDDAFWGTAKKQAKMDLAISCLLESEKGGVLRGHARASHTCGTTRVTIKK